ncbi:MAG TPA: carbon-nitrogen hydrolase family protein [Thermomicrobiales bacterium]|nr:carbon-nitrogen hydrolase family protein [Thermomicrobiales bacterium]
MLPSSDAPFIIASAQAASVFLDRDATVDKSVALINEAAHAGAGLLVFPESFIPAYPDWAWAVPAGQSDVLGDLYATLLSQSVDIPGPATARLCDAAREAGIYVVAGVTERNTEASGGSLYNTLLYIDDGGHIMGKHRKLIPTGGERLVWAQGDGSTLAVFDTPMGRLGGLICWENYMPLARYTLYAWGTQLYVAATWDRGEPWLSTLRHIGREGRVYVIGCCSVLRRADLPRDLADRFYADAGEWLNTGESAIVDPSGAVIAGPASAREEILYADVDPQQIRGQRWMLDVAGHYARPDVFGLTVDTSERPMSRAGSSHSDGPTAQRESADSPPASLNSPRS